MYPHIDVRFHRHVRDASLASTVHRWVARLEAMRFEVASADVEIGVDGRRTSVVLVLTLANGRFATTVTSHVDPYVAVSEAFRSARRELLGCPPVPRVRAL